MAQRKSSPITSAKSGGTARKGRAAQVEATAGRPGGKPGRSIVDQKQKPWGLIVTTGVIVAIAAGIVGYAVLHRSSPSAGALADVTGAVNAGDPYSQPELPAAAAIPGVTYTVEPSHAHVAGSLRYHASPPIGGEHSQYWGDCTGTVYPKAIANENAVHMLEHGAVWITYRPGLPAAEVATLSKLVNGKDYTAMSPYPGLTSNISLQAWGYQLFVNSATDPRIAQFITTLRHNAKTTPEQGATCAEPSFKQHPSTFGHPLWVPA